MKFICRFVFVSLVVAIIGFSGGFGTNHVFAQPIDTTIKPLPDFIQDRPVREEVLTAPDDEADETNDLSAPERNDAPIRSDMSDIPDNYIMEASNFGEECRNDERLNLYYDCRCLGAQYLDARMELGPEAGSSEVRNQLGASCKDATGIAGKMYEECLLDIVNAPTNLIPEEYCSCYANYFSKAFEDWPRRMRIQDEINLRSKSQLVCRDPVAARKVYGRSSYINVK